MNIGPTTWIALVGSFVCLCLVLMLIMHKLAATDFAIAMASVGTMIGVLVGIFSKSGGPTQ